MKLILIRAGRDKFSYTPLTQEHISVREDEDANSKFAVLLRDYRAWLKQGGGSIIELTLYKLDEKTGEMTIDNRIVEKGELRKRVVVNPELAEYRSKTGKTGLKKGPTTSILAAQAMLNAAANFEWAQQEAPAQIGPDPQF